MSLNISASTPNAAHASTGASKRKLEESQAVVADKVDFRDGVNNGTEALMLPLVDPMAGLIAGRMKRGASVVTRCGDQSVEYVLTKPSDFNVRLKINGQPAPLIGKPDFENLGVTLSGEVASGKFDIGVSAGPGELVTRGSVGTVGVEEKIDLDLFGGGVDVSGKVNGEDYALSLNEEGGKGHLGNRPIEVKFEMGPQGTILVHQNMGGARIESEITPR